MRHRGRGSSHGCTDNEAVQHTVSKRKPSGFTLVEMLIVVMIVAIVAAMAVARLGNTSMTKLKAAAAMLTADLGLAQIESIGHAADLRVVVFSTATGTYYLAAASDPDTPINNPMTKGPYRVTFGQGPAHALDGVTLSAISTGGDDRVQFGVYGQLDQAAAATITLTCGEESLVLTVHAVTGEVTLADGS